MVVKKNITIGVRIKKYYPLVFISILIMIASSLLASIDNMTQAVLKSRQDPGTMSLLTQIFPEASSYTYSTDTEIYTLYDDNRKNIGYAFYGQRGGYQSVITILIGLEDKETIKNILITDQNETIGYFGLVTNSGFLTQFIGLKIENCFISQGYASKGIDTVTGATITSSAITYAVRDAAMNKISYLD